MSFAVFAVCMLIYTISISILCVSQGLHLVESNPKIHDIYQTVIFEKQRQCWPLQSKFLYQQLIYFIQCNKGSHCEHVTGGVNIYLYVCVSLLVRAKSSVNLMPCCLLHTTYNKVLLVLTRFNKFWSIILLSKITH